MKHKIQQKIFIDEKYQKMFLFPMFSFCTPTHIRDIKRLKVRDSLKLLQSQFPNRFIKIFLYIESGGLMVKSGQDHFVSVILLPQ